MILSFFFLKKKEKLYRNNVQHKNVIWYQPKSLSLLLQN